MAEDAAAAPTQGSSAEVSVHQEPSRFLVLLHMSLFTIFAYDTYAYSVGDAWFGHHWEQLGSSAPQVAAAYGMYGSSNIAGLVLLLGLMAFLPNLATAASASVFRQLQLVLSMLTASLMAAVCMTALPDSYPAFMLSRSVQVWEGDSMDLISQVHLRIMDLQARHNTPSATDGLPASTAILEHGMNPGMVNHFVLKALKEAAEASGLTWPEALHVTIAAGQCDKAALMSAYAEVAYKLGLTSIHSTDVYYQLSDNYKPKGKVLASTWSVPAFWEEASAVPEWHAGTSKSITDEGRSRGSDAKIIEAPCSEPMKDGITSSTITIVAAYDAETGMVAWDASKQGFLTWAKSYSAPQGYYDGMLISHGENYSLGRNLTLWRPNGTGTGEAHQPVGGSTVWQQMMAAAADDTNNATGAALPASGSAARAIGGGTDRPLQALWSPEVAFIYRPNNMMIDSIYNNGVGDLHIEDVKPYILQTSRDKMEDYVTVGVLLRFDAEHSKCKYRWSWCGNTLGYSNPKLSHPMHNATVMQVVAAVMAGLQYMLEFPSEGICFPEELAHSKFIQERSLQWLGNIDVMHSTEPLAGLPPALTAPGALVTPDIQAVAESSIATLPL